MDYTNLSSKFIPIIGITIGDLNGIGMEVILKSLENISEVYQVDLVLSLIHIYEPTRQY